jgi:hypothetical protein
MGFTLGEGGFDSISIYAPVVSDLFRGGFVVHMFSLLDVGNFFLFISGFLMIYTAYKDREVLTGYNFTGTVMLATGISFVIVFYLQEGYYISTVLTLPNYFYWLVVITALVQQKAKKQNKVSSLLFHADY